jgi:hypothetical protein
MKLRASLSRAVLSMGSAFFATAGSRQHAAEKGMAGGRRAEEAKLSRGARGMAVRTASRYVSGNHDDRDARPQRLIAAAALASFACACVWIVCADLTRFGGDKDIDGAGGTADQVEVAVPRGDKLAIARPQPQLASNDDASLFDPHYLGFAPGRFVASAPPQAMVQAASPPPVATAVATPEAAPPRDDRVAQSAVVPAPPLNLTPLRNARRDDLRAAHTVVAAQNRESDQDPNWQANAEPSLLEKLFGMLSPKPASATLAYAAPDDKTILSDWQSVAGGRYDRWTAVYDISAHRVYLPDGRTLEAHSGYGDRLDDPRSADVRDRGVTPPNVYDLAPRETLFHGVAALRLIPVDDDKVFGRTGFLAHSYMLGPNGDSNGCVSFRDYDAFLAAYSSGEIKRLAVVDRLD